MMALVIPTSQVEHLRDLVVDDKTAVQIMTPPSYLRPFLRASEASDNVILVYKTNSKTSAASLPISFSPDDSYLTDLDVTGHPLESPFEDENFDDTVFSVKQFLWMKSELNQLPLPLQNARAIINSWNETVPLKAADEDGTPFIDVWVLSNDGSWEESNKCNGKSPTANGALLDVSNLELSQVHEEKSKTHKISTVMLGRHFEDKWYTRTIVKAHGLCSISSPDMDPHILKQRHLHASKLPASKVRTHVLCRYTVSGHPVATDPSVDSSNLESCSCVSLELEWNKLSISVPLETATTNLVTQVVVGHHSSPAYALWKQLRLLQKLLDLLLACWHNKRAPTLLPQENLSDEDDPEESFESLGNKLELLIQAGGSALLAKTGSSREALAAPSQNVVGRRSLAPGYLRRRSFAPKSTLDGDFQTSHLSLSEALNIVANGTRENSDLTDELWCLLTKCKSYDELSRAWTIIFSEVTKGHSRPYIRPKNKTKAGKLIQGLIYGHMERGPDFYEVEGCGIFEPLELLVELGLEKLATDFYYIFLDSETVSKDCLMAPELLRNDITVSRDKWLPSCGGFLGWLAQIFTSLEVMLTVFKSLPSPDKAVINLAPLALKHFQSETSPVRSVSSLLTSCWQEFHCVVSTREVQNLLTEKFDLLKVTLTSESEMRKVRSVFLRSRSSPIFPPQIYSCGETLNVDGENIMYYCAEALTLSDFLGSE